jgi:UDP-N-acetylglucosamine 2-epimerase (non-hydrolysing)
MGGRGGRTDLGGPWVAVAGARPNFVKLLALLEAARAEGRRLLWVDAAQHRSAAMARALLAPLALPAPAARLRPVRAGPARIARMAEALAAPLAALRPSLVVAIGDVDATAAAAIAARTAGLPLAHVEACSWTASPTAST